MNEERTLPEILDAIRWRWKLVLLIAVPLTLAATFYAESLPAEFESESIVSVSPRTEEVSPTQVTVGGPKYVAFATAPATIREVAPDVDVDPATLEEAVDATLAEDTGNITITVRLESPERTAATANAFAEALEDFSTTDGLLTVDLVAPAIAPSRPAGPPRRLMEAAALVIGLFAGLVVAFLVERSHPRVRTWRDIAVLTGYPVIGRIPVSRAMREGPERVAEDPTVGTAFRTLRTNLERELGAEASGSVVVTSAVPAEGKTATAGMLATTLARLGSRVLLIDADLHRTGLTRGLQASTGKGFAEVLKGDASLVDSVTQGWTAGLFVLPTTPEPEAGELITRNIEHILMEARQLFDVVVLDAPPLLGADDTPTISTMVDGVLLVVSAGANADTLSEATLSLRALRVNVWGVVANRLPRTGPGGAASYLYAPQTADR